MKCVAGHTVTFRFENGPVSVPSVKDVVEEWDKEDAC